MGLEVDHVRQTTAPTPLARGRWRGRQLAVADRHDPRIPSRAVDQEPAAPARDRTARQGDGRDAAGACSWGCETRHDGEMGALVALGEGRASAPSVRVLPLVVVHMLRICRPNLGAELEKTFSCVAVTHALLRRKGISADAQAILSQVIDCKRFRSGQVTHLTSGYRWPFPSPLRATKSRVANGFRRAVLPYVGTYSLVCYNVEKSGPKWRGVPCCCCTGQMAPRPTRESLKPADLLVSCLCWLCADA